MENDEHLELKGAALSTLWRDQIATEELFTVLEEPSLNFLGSYTSFFYDLERKLEIKDLWIALKWLKTNAVKIGDLSFNMNRLPDAIMSLAWQNLDKVEIFELYTNAVLPFLKIQRNGFIDSNFANDNKLDSQDAEKKLALIFRFKK